MISQKLYKENTMLKYSKPVTDDYNNSFWTYKKALAKLESGDVNPMMTLIHDYCRCILYNESPDEHMTKAFEWSKTLNVYNAQTLIHSINTKRMATEIVDLAIEGIRLDLSKWSANKSKPTVNASIPEADKDISMASLVCDINELLLDEQLNKKDTSLLTANVSIADITVLEELYGMRVNGDNNDKGFGLLFEVHYLDEEGGDAYNYRFKGFNYTNSHKVDYSDALTEILPPDLIALNDKLELLHDLLIRYLTVFITFVLTETHTTDITEERLKDAVLLFDESIKNIGLSKNESTGNILLIDNTSTILNTVDGAKYGLYTGRY